MTGLIERAFSRAALLQQRNPPIDGDSLTATPVQNPPPKAKYHRQLFRAGECTSRNCPKDMRPSNGWPALPPSMVSNT